MAVPSALSVDQQSKTFKVTGQITDKAKEPLIGVTVTVVGSNGPIRTISDIDGMFSLDVPEVTKPLSSLMQDSKKLNVPVTGSKSLNVVMEEDTKDIDEVVVTGFSSQKKASIVGAIQTIQPTELKFGNTRTLSNNLAGKLSGVIGINVQVSLAMTILISGFVVSVLSQVTVHRWYWLMGVERDLNSVDVSEIESFSILKDASASAMYGVRGANGVIVITTKHGKIGAPAVRFHRGAVYQFTNETTKVLGCTRLYEFA